MTTTNHLNVRTEHVRTNETGRTGANRATQYNQITEGDSTAPDPLIGWHALGKQTKEQQQRTTNIRQRGRIDGVLLAHVLFVIVLVLVLLIGGLIA